MPTWRCPHCGTPQTETARCWVCRRSSTACGTCRHFRRSVAAQLGYCGLDRRRAPIAGDEIRACWEAWPAMPATGPGSAAGPSATTTASDRTHRLEFVEIARTGPEATAAVRGAASSGTETAASDGPTPAVGGPSTLGSRPGEPGWNLWGDLEI